MRKEISDPKAENKRAGIAKAMFHVSTDSCFYRQLLIVQVDHFDPRAAAKGQNACRSDLKIYGTPHSQTRAMK